MMNDPVRLLDEAIQAQRLRMGGYEVASEAITFETLRAIDFSYCRELFPELPTLDGNGRQLESIRHHGVSAALRRVMPTSLEPGQPRLFRSNDRTAEQADEFLLDSGTLELAEQQLQFVRAGILEAHIAPRQAMGLPIVVLSVNDVTAYREQVGHRSLNWLSEQIDEKNRGREQALEERHRHVLPLIVRHLKQGAAESEMPFDDVDEYFHDWASLYLRRMPFRVLTFTQN